MVHLFFTKVSWKPSLKFADSLEHIKGYADNVTLIPDDFDTHKSVLHLIDLKATIIFQTCKMYFFPVWW